MNLSRIYQINRENKNTGKKTFSQDEDNNSQSHLVSVRAGDNSCEISMYRFFDISRPTSKNIDYQNCNDIFETQHY